MGVSSVVGGASVHPEQGGSWQWQPPPGWPAFPIGFAPGAEWIPDWNWPAPAGHYSWWNRNPSVALPEHWPGYEDESFTEPQLEAEIPAWTPPPNWPRVPDGWAPPPGWIPNPEWGPAPLGWNFWRKNRAAHLVSQRKALRDQVRRILLNTASPMRQMIALNLIETDLLSAKYAFYHDAIPVPSEMQAGVHVPTDHPDALTYRNVFHSYVHALTAQREELLRCLHSGITPGLEYVESARLSKSLDTALADARSVFIIRQAYLFRSTTPDRDAADQFALEQRRRFFSALTYTRGAEESAGSEPAGAAGDDWKQAESLAAETLRGFGYSDAAVTPPGADGGFDVVGSRVVGQVKYHARPVGRPELQRLVGANTRLLDATFFSRSGYSQQAIHYANVVHMALFEIELPREVRPLNEKASKLIRA